METYTFVYDGCFCKAEGTPEHIAAVKASIADGTFSNGTNAPAFHEAEIKDRG